jgi:hypothetical protein
MVRFTLTAVMGGMGLVALPAVCLYTQEPQPVAPAPAQEKNAPGQLPAQGPYLPVPVAGVVRGVDLVGLILWRGATELEPAELAGVAAGSKPAVLGLEQAYSLTLVRARNPAGLLAVGRTNLFDPAALDEEAKRAGVPDFDRFRGEFVSSVFRDPAPGFLTALKHRQAIDSARDQLALTENIRRLFDELIRGEASGVSQLQLEQVDLYLLQSRQNLDLELTSYRTAVDELKLLVGLPPSVPIVLDERILQPFVKAFRSIDVWQRNPRRQLGMLGALHNRLPRLPELKIGGRSLAHVAQGTIPEVEFLLACTEAATKRRMNLKDEQAARGERDSLELRIRKLARGLILCYRRYEVERKRVELEVREVDQTFEQLINPPAGGTSALAQAANAALHTSGVLQAQSRLYRGRSELVSEWLRFQEQSLELYRELGALPYDNWAAFHRSFLPDGGGDGGAP